MTSFPTEPPYIHKKVTGLGFKYPITTSLAIVHRVQLQSIDAANIAAGMLMIPQRHQQSFRSRFQGGSLNFPMNDKTIAGRWAYYTSGWTISRPTNTTQHHRPLSRHLNSPIKTANIDRDTTHSRSSPSEYRNWTPIAYANEDLQFTHHTTRPVTFETPTDITLRTMMTFQQEDRDQKIHQFLCVMSNSMRCCFKIWKAKDQTTSEPKTSKWDRLHQRHPIPRLRPWHQYKTTEVTGEEC